MYPLRGTMFCYGEKMNVPLKSSPPSDEDLFYLEWAKETIKKNIENAHGALVQFITLNTTLLGGSIVFLKPEVIGKVFLSASFSLFFIALLISFLGILPHESTVSIISPSEIKAHKIQALSKKRKLMWSCAAFTGSGLLIMGVGVIIGA